MKEMSGRCLLRLTRMLCMLECQEGKPQAGQTRIYSPSKQIEPLALSLGEIRGHRTLLKGHRTLSTSVRCSNVSRVSESNGHLLRCTPESCAESSANLRVTGR